MAIVSLDPSLLESPAVDDASTIDPAAVEATMTEFKEITDDSSKGEGTEDEAAEVEEKADAADDNSGEQYEESKTNDENSTNEPQPDEDANNEGADENPDNSEGEELWDLRVVFEPSDILRPNPIPCSTEGCNLTACCVYASRNDPETPWYTCLDCQANDFGGWPERKDLVALRELTGEHWGVILERCTVDAEVSFVDSICFGLMLIPFHSICFMPSKIYLFFIHKLPLNEIECQDARFARRQAARHCPFFHRNIF